MMQIIHRIMSLILVLTVFAFANILYVDNNLGDGFWQGAYADLQEALSAASDGDEIWVAQGTYTPGVDRSDSFVLKEGVKLYGGFYGGESALSDRDIHANPTILSGDIGVKGDDSDNTYHVIYSSGLLSNLTLIDGFIIRDGNADDGNGGGGMLLLNGSAPYMQNCVFYKNQSSESGGAVFLKNAVTFSYCLFDNNTAGQGGAIYSPEDKNELGDVSVDHCTFVNNVAAEGSALCFDKRESVYVDSSIFWNNTDGAGNINSFSLDTRVGQSSVINSACDDNSFIAVTKSNIIYYTSNDLDGPFINISDYRIDNEHGIPREYGWYYIPTPLVLNVRVFLEGPF